MEYSEIAEQLANSFRRNPVDYVAEADLQTGLVEALRTQLSPEQATATDVGLEGASSSSFKQEYWQSVQRKLSERETLNRVHTEVSVRQGERVDVAVFSPELTQPIKWVSGGSKRFSAEDLECVFEIKFVKNKTSFPKHTGHPIDELSKLDPSIESILQQAGSNDPLLDFGENKIRGDIHELNRLKKVNNRFLLLFSNNNYLYHNPTQVEKEDYRYGRLYHKMGKAAQQWMRSEANDDVGILYAHPLGSVWLTK